jgi:hypothetical protein
VTTSAGAKPALVGGCVRNASAVSVAALARSAYGFIQEHLCAVVMLTQILRRGGRLPVNTSEEEQW